MIYLIDDKKLRQERDYGWTQEKFENNIIQPIYTLKELQDKRKEVFKEGNIILYHESFLDQTSLSVEAAERRKDLDDFSQKRNCYLVLFSGSKKARGINDNVANTPVSVLYKNLEVFVEKYRKEDLNLQYLLFGENIEAEESLIKKEKTALTKTEYEDAAIISTGKTLLIRPAKNNIKNPIKDCSEKTIFSNVSDQGLSEKISKWLSEIKYENIFIPLCFGNTLSDFNGLRLACHIRCSSTFNQTSKIFIYGFVGLEDLLDNEYFNILKTKNVQLVPFSKKEFETFGNQQIKELKRYELPKEIAKLKLNIPKNYADNHSITNEWAIYRWAKTIGCDETEELTKVFKNFEANLYFKYLRTLKPITQRDIIPKDELEIHYNGNPKVLMIDDEAEKGWIKIFTHLLDDINDIYVDYLGDGFKSLKSEKIIETSIKKIKKDAIDIVILDFRLNDADFDKKRPEEMTSVKMLKEIKKLNPGIQVIGFSATNKIWNLQVLQDVGVDRFIFKEGGTNPQESINGLIGVLKSSIEKAAILKPIYLSFKKIRKLAASLSERFNSNLKDNLVICFDLLIKSFEQDKYKYRNYAYLQLFLIAEEFIKEDTVFEFGDNCYVISPVSRYLVLSKKDSTDKKSPSDSAITFKNGHYKIKKSLYCRRVDTNFKMSAILLFRYGCETSGELNWSEIYSIRNKKAAHPELGIVEISGIEKLATFLIHILNEENIKSVEQKHALKEISVEEKLEKLKEKFNSK